MTSPLLPIDLSTSNHEFIETLPAKLFGEDFDNSSDDELWEEDAANAHASSKKMSEKKNNIIDDSKNIYRAFDDSKNSPGLNMYGHPIKGSIRKSEGGDDDLARQSRRSEPQLQAF